jgi:rhamnulokinase
MNNEKRFLAFDLGAESGRAVVGEIKDDRLTLTEIHRFPTGGTKINNHLQWNILGFYTHLIEGLKNYVSKYGGKLDGIGIDTWGVDFGLLDKNGGLLSNPYTYRDSRTEGASSIIDKKLGNKELYYLTGIQLLPFNTVNQLVSMVENKDPILDITENILFIGDLLNYFLTGVKTTEYTVASISQLYNTVTREWEPKIYKALGIPERISAKVIKAGDLVGTLNGALAGELGLGEVQVIAPAVHDTASAAVSVPAGKEEEWAFLSSGTWSIVGFELDKPIINDKSYEMNISNSGGALDKTLYLKNVMGLWIIQCCKRMWNKTNPNLSYPEIENMATEAKPFAAFIDPDDLIFLNPADAVEAVKEYCRRTKQLEVDKNDIGVVGRIIFESLALKYRYVLEKLMDATGRKADVLYITGGGSKNRLLNQFTANALGRKVNAGPVEATAIGNIMMQAVGSGLYYSLNEIRKIIRNSFDIEQYMPLDTEKWNIAYESFKEIIERRD